MPSQSKRKAWLALWGPKSSGLRHRNYHKACGRKQDMAATILRYTLNTHILSVLCKSSENSLMPLSHLTEVRYNSTREPGDCFTYSVS